MDYTAVRQFCLKQFASREEFPFGADIIAFTTQGQIFAILYFSSGEARLNLRAEPRDALMLRQIFPAITAGQQLNKNCWNTIVLDNTVPEGELKRQIEQSWELAQPNSITSPQRRKADVR